jgi:hypothetical protein
MTAFKPRQDEQGEPCLVVDGYDVWQGISGWWHARQLGSDSPDWDVSGEDLEDLRDMIRRYEVRQGA